jgi:peptide/nickel transport system permease protein
VSAGARGRRRRLNPTLGAGLSLAGALALAAAAAPWLAAADPAHPFDAAAGKRLPPGASRFVVEFHGGRLPVLAERAERRGGELVLHRLDREEAVPAAAVANLGPEGLPPRRTFVLGTDRLGRDLWARLVHGARVSLAVGLLATALALTLGVAVGCAAALGGGAADAVLMRLVDLVLAFPRLFLLIAVVALLRRPSGWTIVLVLGGTTWMVIGRLVRAEILALKRRDFVIAARALGQRPAAILFRHLLPHAVTPALVAGGLLVGDVILTEAALSFLGLGVPEPAPSWGKTIADVAAGPFESWWVALFPGVAITAAVIAFNLIADGLRDALDVRS